MRVLSLWHGVSERRETMRELLEETAHSYEIPVAELKGQGRTRPVCHARQAFMWAAYETGRYSLPQIGRFLGRDHTTVLYGVRAHQGRQP